jgi:hypothetical protein
MKTVRAWKAFAPLPAAHAPHLGGHETLAFIRGPALAQLLFLDPVRLLGISAGTDSGALVSELLRHLSRSGHFGCFSPFWIYRSSSTTQIRTIDFGNHHIAIEWKYRAIPSTRFATDGGSLIRT